MKDTVDNIRENMSLLFVATSVEFPVFKFKIIVGLLIIMINIKSINPDII